jgi:glycerol uptake facilitator protein
VDVNDIIVAEAIGTALLIILGCGVVAGVLLDHSKAQNAGWIVITFGWGLAVMTGAFAVGDFGGAHLNPAVTLGFWAADVGDLSGGDVVQYIVGQFIGAFIGAVIVWAAYLVHWGETQDPGLKLAVFSTGPAIRNPLANVITEFVGTFVLVFGILGIVNNVGTAGNEAEGIPGSGVGPLLVGLLVVGIGLSLGGPTGYAINPARDLGPRIAHAILPIPGKGTSDWAYSWVPVVAPILGGVVGALAFKAFFPTV